MRAQQSRPLLAVLLAASTAVLAFGLRPIPAASWPGNARWQVVYECVGAAIALEVAIFALSRFGLEQRRLPLFIGLGYLSAAIADMVAALLCQGNYLVPPVGETQALMSVAAAGRWLLAICLWGGLLAQRYSPTAPKAGRELAPVTVIGAAGAFAVVQMAIMVPLPGLMRLTGVVHRPWDLFAAMLLSAALPGYWRLYRELGRPIIQTVLVSLVLMILSQIFMAQSAALYDSSWNVAMLLKVASYAPPLVGLFIASVTSCAAAVDRPIAGRADGIAGIFQTPRKQGRGAHPRSGGPVAGAGSVLLHSVPRLEGPVAGHPGVFAVPAGGIRPPAR